MKKKYMMKFEKKKKCRTHPLAPATPDEGHQCHSVTGSHLALSPGVAM